MVSDTLTSSAYAGHGRSSSDCELSMIHAFPFRRMPHDALPFPAVHHEPLALRWVARSEEHTSELQSLMRISYAVFCLKKKTNTHMSSLEYKNCHTPYAAHNHTSIHLKDLHY